MFSSLNEVLAEQAITQPDTVGYVYLGDGSVESARRTYAELDRRARAIGAMLASRGGRGERVLLLFPPGLEFLDAFFGCMYSGCIAVPLPAPDDSRVKRTFPRFLSVAEDARASFVLTTRAVVGIRDEVSSQFPSLASAHWIAVEDVPDNLALDWKPAGVATDELAYLQYSSGSTSEPKGVMISHANLLHNVTCMLDRGEYTAPRASVTWLPHFHDYGLVHGLLVPLFNAGTCYVMPPLSFLKRPVRWLRAISRYHAEISQAPPFGYDYCVRRIRTSECRDLDLRNWIGAGISAEPIRLDTMRQFAEKFELFGFRWKAFCPAYGLAEATLMVSTDSPAAQPASLRVETESLEQDRVIECPENAAGTRVLAGSGSLVPGITVKIVDPQTSNQCDPGKVGEIWCAGDSIAAGYWNNPQETERVFRARLATGEQETYLRTGDLGFVANRQLFVTGRLKDLIVIAGANHYPQDIERTVEASHPDLRPLCSAAFSVDVDGHERLVVLAEATTRVDECPRIRDAIRQAIAQSHEIETYGVAILKPGSISKTSSGKIQRSDCRRRYLNGTLEIISESRSYTTPPPLQAPPSEKALREWLRTRFAALAGIDANLVDTSEPLARYGMTSVEAISTVADLERWLERELPATLLYEQTTIDAVATYLFPDGAAVAEALPPRRSFADEPVAIIGIGCRFPGADGPEVFWRMMRDGVDAVGEVPAERWDIDEVYAADSSTPGKMNTRWGGFVKDAAGFDAHFFGITPREATHMDPQQRMLLEVAVEALEDAGIPQEKLAATQSGVFIGISTSDYAFLQLGDVSSLDGYSQTGSALSIAANRLSYTFDLRGPSMAIDSACSSSLTAVHMACQSLRLGESTLALAGGVNLILIPEWTIAASQARMMSADGRCKAFDAKANGYVRAEGCGLVVLKRLADAVCDRDPILAIIRGTAANQDGRSNGLTAPNPAQQQQVIQLAMRDAGVHPGEIDYVEAHGTGTPLGDPIEFQALSATVGKERAPDKPCRIGSVKTNIGHLEAAAGIAGLIKVALALAHEEIPPQRGLSEINPYVKLKGSGLEIATAPTPWPRNGKPRLAAVSSFGVGGSNAHAILEEAPVVRVDPSDAKRPLHLLTIAARTKAALLDLAKRYEQQLSHDLRFPDIAYTSNVGRCHHARRLAAVAGNSEEARQKLSEFISAHSVMAGQQENAEGARRPKIAFVLGARGMRYPDTSRRLFAGSEVFQGALDECGQILTRDMGLSLVELLEPSNRGQEPASDSPLSGAAVFAVQWATAQLWKSWGIEPDAVVTQGAGEYVARCLRGAMSLPDGLRAALGAATSSVPGTEHCATQIQAALAEGCDTFLALGNDVDLSHVVHELLPPNAALLFSFARGQDDWRQLLESLGEIYVRGAAVDWDSFTRASQGRKVSVPAYPFQHRRYWLEQTRPRDATPARRETGPVHPWAGSLLRSPALNGVVFQTALSPSAQPFLREHKVYGRVVLPASSYVEMALTGMQAGLGASFPLSLRECDLAQALVLPEGKTVTVQTIFQQGGDALVPFQIVSYDDDSDGWNVHVTGKVRGQSNAASSGKLRFEDVRERCNEKLSATDLYSALARMSLEYGAGFQGVTEVWRRNGEALARIRLPLAASASDAGVFPPALLDSCFHVILAAQEEKGMDQAFVPVYIGSLDVFGPVPEQFWVRAVVSTAGSVNSGLVNAELYLADAEGRVFAEFAKLTLRRASREMLFGSDTEQTYRDWFYRFEWQTKESDFFGGQMEDGRWLILADQGGIGESLRQLLESEGQQCTCYYAEDELVLSLQADVPLRGVVHLWALDPTEDQRRICGSVQRIVKAISEARLASAPRLCLVTRGTQSADSSMPANSPAGSTLWGLANILTAEHPELRTVTIDLAPEVAVNETRFLFEELQTSDAETRVAMRKGLRHVQRLSRLRTPDTGQELPAFTSDATYLITGGLGALGLKVAGWMVERGAKHLVLVSRSKPSDVALELVDAWTKLGSEITFAQADISDPKAVGEVLAWVAKSMPPLRGVVHAAGVLDDGLVIQQNWERFAAVLKPKVNGAWNLHLQTLDVQLDFFLMFSSAAAFMPNQGQASYAAGNAFLDSLAQVRRGQGLPALSVNWGIWEKTGLSDGRGKQEQKRLAAFGVRGMASEQGLAALGTLFNGSDAQIAVLPIDWKKYFSHYREGTEPRLLSKLVEESRSLLDSEELQKSRAKLLRRLEEATPLERQELVEDFIAQQVMEVLAFKSRDEVDLSAGFFEIGLDSMMAVELQSRVQTGLGISIPATTPFDQPNIKALALYLLQKFLVFEQAPRRPGLENEDTLSEERILALLAEEPPEPATSAAQENS